jgi:hypothetical protein
MSAQASEIAAGGLRSAAKQFTVGQPRDRPRERLRRKLARPHRQLSGGRCFGEAGAIDDARKRGRGIEPAPRHGQREQKRRKAHSKVGNARVSRGQSTHRCLEARIISPKPTFEQVKTPGHPARGQHQIRGHDNSASAVKPRQIRFS